MLVLMLNMNMNMDVIYLYSLIKSKLGRVSIHVAMYVDDTSWIDKEHGLFVRINHLAPTLLYLYTMPDLSQAVPAKDLKQWHSPSSRNEAIDTLIHGVGRLTLPENRIKLIR
jgi:hypothetical protein